MRAVSFRPVGVAAAAASLLFAAAAAQAHEAGDFIFRTGIVGARLSSETITEAGVDTDNLGNITGTYSSAMKKTGIQAGVNLTYMVTDHVGVEFTLTSQFSHKVTGHGSALTTWDGHAGKVKQLPLSLNAVYYPLDKQSALQPYVGAGITYTFASFKLNNGWPAASVAAGENDFTRSDVEDVFSIKNRFGWNLAMGADYNLTNNWLLNANVRYVRTNNKARDADGQHMAKGAVYYMLGVGYKF